MTDLEVMEAIRRRLSGLVEEVSRDPGATEVQFLYAMDEVAKEMAARLPKGVNMPPVNREAPKIEGKGELGQSLTAKMGSWDNDPTDYSFQWLRDGAPVGDNSINYRVDTADQGHEITCVVSAVNAKGLVAGPPSNGIKVAEPKKEEASSTTRSTPPTPPPAPASGSRAEEPARRP
jgi:hypothetical protein